MRRVIGYATLATLLWSAYWLGMTWTLRSAYLDWLADQRSRGWIAGVAGIESGGFPTRHAFRLHAPSLADPHTGLAWSADWIDLETPALLPRRLGVIFSPGEQRVSIYDRSFALTTTGMRAGLRLGPGEPSQLRQIGLAADILDLADPLGRKISVSGLELSMTQLETPESYRISLHAAGLSYPDGNSTSNDPPAAIQRSFDRLAIRATVAFDRPWDLHALERRRPQPRQISIELAEIHMGDLGLQMVGNIAVDQTGSPSGEVTIRAADWRHALAAARASGLVHPERFNVAAHALDLVSRFGGDPETLDVTLRLREGNVALGPVPLGTMPKLVIR